MTRNCGECPAVNEDWRIHCWSCGAPPPRYTPAGAVVIVSGSVCLGLAVVYVVAWALGWLP